MIADLRLPVTLVLKASAFNQLYEDELWEAKDKGREPVSAEQFLREHAETILNDEGDTMFWRIEAVRA